MSSWNLFVLYFGVLNPPKEGPFQSKQGSFGFKVYIYIYFICFKRGVMPTRQNPVTNQLANWDERHP